MLTARSIKAPLLRPAPNYKGAAAAKRLNALLKHSYANRVNPTVALIIRKVVESVSRSEPLHLLLHQRFLPSKAVQRAKVEYLLWGGVRNGTIPRMIEGVDCRAWPALRSLLEKDPQAYRLTVLVDDQEIANVHAAHEWCQAAARKALALQIADWTTRLERAAEKYFSRSNLQFQRTSAMIDVDSFRSQRRHAADFSKWLLRDRNGIIESSLEMSCDLWGTSNGVLTRGLPARTTQMLVCHELVSLAAHNRIIAQICSEPAARANSAPNSEMAGIVVWNASLEACPMWPVILSNYDGGGYSASLVY